MPYHDIILDIALFLIGAGVLLLIIQLMSDSLNPQIKIFKLLMAMSVWNNPEFKYPKYRTLCLDQEYRLGKAVVKVYALRKMIAKENETLDDKSCPEKYGIKTRMRVVVDGNNSILAPTLSWLTNIIIESIAEDEDKIIRYKRYKD